MKRILLLFTLCTLTIVSWSQKPVSSDVFDQAINKISYELALQSVTDEGNHLAAFNEKLVSECDMNKCCSDKCIYEMKYFLGNSGLQATVRLCEKIATYKSKYTEDSNGKEQYAIVQSVFQDTLVKKFIRKRTTNLAFGEKLRELQKSINKTFDYKENNEPLANTETTENPTTGLETQVSKTTGGSSWLGWLSTILLLGAIGGYMFLLRPKYQKRLLELKKEIAKLAEQNKTLSEQNNSLTAKIGDLEGKNEALFRNENMLRDRLARYEKSEEEIKEQRKQAPVEPTYPKNEEGMTVYEIFYMPVPNKDGSFEDGHQSDKFEWTESVYKFEVVNKEGTKALFSIMNDQRMIKRAISGYDIYIKPVCRAANAFNMNVSRIVTEEKGQAVLNGDRWELDDKALISYQV